MRGPGEVSLLSGPERRTLNEGRDRPHQDRGEVCYWHRGKSEGKSLEVERSWVACSRGRREVPLVTLGRPDAEGGSRGCTRIRHVGIFSVVAALLDSLGKGSGVVIGFPFLGHGLGFAMEARDTS